MYLKVREDGRVRSRGLFIATGVHTDGTRKVLGHMLGDSESEETWGAFFQELKQRGLRGVDYIVTDQHGGLMRAIHQYFQGATWHEPEFRRSLFKAKLKRPYMGCRFGFGEVL
ncbi:transposase and inactivated derivative [Paenibacillus popilliae ATCC 14706]|uniref:Mutator family transposase n=1 Tax=Paenibacillus popilliae ATCC 14706 TaxID=1212764 RepID=M9LIA7_PAEPP|nr:IS256 family transposase [Paenibacillus popilliae]GAC42760.1 transposase and inactivated derivative [Paenibacillus popilliae ATCC 14706]